MALPPDSADAFVREVDENLRRDRTEEFLKRNLRWIVGAGLLLIALVGGYIWWENHQKQVASEEGERLGQALDRIGDGNVEGAAKALIPISDSSIDADRASALLTRAAIALRQNQTKTAIDLYKKVEDDGGLAQPYRDLALMRRTMVEYDSIKPDEVIARMKPHVEAGKPFFGTAGELTAMAMLAKGDKAGAGQLFAKLAADKTVPESIRSRAAQVAGSLGIDASASVAGIGDTLSQ